MTMDGQKFCLKWDGFQSSVTSLFDSLRRVEELVDVTLCCEGHQVHAHRMMLSACSPYFRDLLKSKPCQQLVIFLKDTSAADLNAVIEFIYQGSVNVAQTQLASFIKTAEMLQIRGLSGDEEKAAPAAAPSPRRSVPATPPQKRRRLSGSDFPARQSPASPVPRPRTPSPPGPPPELGADPGQMEPPGPPRQLPETVKVEKIDLTEEGDEASLDSTLCHVAEYEGGYDGSNSGLDQMAMVADLAGLPPGLGAGPSQPPPRPPAGHPGPAGPPGDDGTGTDGYRNKCTICFREYKHRVSLLSHMKVHQGMTTCPRCEKVCCTVKDLRKHMECVHSMTQEEVRSLVPTKPKFYSHMPYYPANQ